MKNIPIIIMGLALLGVCSCKKSKEEQLAADADNAAASVRFALTNGVDLNTNNQRLAIAEEAARGARMALTNQVNLETHAALAVLKQLHESDRLPNVSKDDHGHMTSDMVDLFASNEAITIVYPASRVFHLVKNGETSTNNYMLVKQSKDSEWKLQKAWQTDSKGQIIQEWPVK